MENLLATYRDDEDDEDEWSNGNLDHTQTSTPQPPKLKPSSNNPNNHLNNNNEEEGDPLEVEEDDDELEEEDDEEEDIDLSSRTFLPLPKSKYPQPFNNENGYEDDREEEEEDTIIPRKKQKPLSSFTETEKPSPTAIPKTTPIRAPENATKKKTMGTTKKPKKKNTNNVWTKSISRKGKKKTKPTKPTATEDTVLTTPVPRFPDKNDDTPEMKICLSKVYKAEKVELSDDRLSASSSKGYRMVRATRGVVEGAWFFEIKVLKLGETGHTRLGWSTDKGDLQAPVGYDVNSFGYRDVDGSKVHKALREKYGDEGYIEGDVVGCYISLPDGNLYAPKPPQIVWYKGHRYICAPDGKEDPPKVIPGSEISFFKNGVCQGVAFTDLYGGRYYPAASMYTLPNQPNCIVKFNFGPDFEFFPQDFDGRLLPKPMIEVPYHEYYYRGDGVAQNGISTENKL